MFSCEIHEIFKSTYFEEHLRTASSIFYTLNQFQPNFPCLFLIKTSGGSLMFSEWIEIKCWHEMVNFNHVFSKGERYSTIYSQNTKTSDHLHSHPLSPIHLYPPKICHHPPPPTLPPIKNVHPCPPTQCILPPTPTNP